MKKKIKYIYALSCNGHFSLSELYATKRKAEKEGETRWHRKCDKQVVKIMLN